MDDTVLLKAIYASATDYAIITMDNEGVITSWNPGAEKILGYRREEIVGKNGAVIFTAEDCAKGVPSQEFATARETGRAADYRWHVRQDGSRFWGEGLVMPLLDSAGKQLGYLKMMHDNTSRKQAEDALRRLVHFDSLTGLANRSYLYGKLNEMVATAMRSDQHLILLLIDLDHFKQINDSLGHHVGDIVLQQAAERMQCLLRGTDLIARLAGDEFVILQANAHTPEAGAVLAEKLLGALSVPYKINGSEIAAGASIGISVCPQDATDAESLLKKADLALYRVKNNGRSGFSYFTEQMDQEVHARNRRLAELRRAVDANDFWVEYQPEIDCRSGQIIALEALLRCRNPILSHYPIEEIIELAAEAGLAQQLGLWVVDQACAQQKEWQKAGLPHWKMAVNLCPQELMNQNIADQIVAILKKFELQPFDLEVEITERQIFDSRGEGIPTLKNLRSHGISITLDDFGAGYSSLGYLRHLPVDRLKLDRMFLKEIPRDHASCVIAESVISMANALDIKVTAEGVESGEQAEFFRNKRCHSMQGFFFSRSLPAADLAQWATKEHCVRRSEWMGDKSAGWR